MQSICQGFGYVQIHFIPCYNWSMAILKGAHAKNGCLDYLGSLASSLQLGLKGCCYKPFQTLERDFWGNLWPWLSPSTVNLHLWSVTSHLTLGLRCMGSSTIFGLQLNLYPYNWGDQYSLTHILFHWVLVVIIFVAQEVACGCIKSSFMRQCSSQSCWIGAFLLMRVFKIMTFEFLLLIISDATCT